MGFKGLVGNARVKRRVMRQTGGVKPNSLGIEVQNEFYNLTTTGSRNRGFGEVEGTSDPQLEAIILYFTIARLNTLI